MSNVINKIIVSIYKEENKMICINFGKYSGQSFDSYCLSSDQIKVLQDICNAGGAEVYVPGKGKVLVELKVVAKAED